MRRTHFERFRPVCPRCRAQFGELHPLTLGTVARETDRSVDQGVLNCPSDACRQEYPVLDGLPVLVPNVRAWVNENLDHLLARDDLSAPLESLFGDCSGPNSTFDARRQHLSNYVRDHWGDLDPDESADDDAPPGSATRTLRRGLELLGPVTGPALDLGCAAGRGAFELASHTGDLVLGVDLHAPLLRAAARVVRERRVSYARRRVGVVYDRRDFAVDVPGHERVDVWVADALALPFAPATFGVISAQHVLDCVTSPVGLLHTLADALAPGGGAVLASPYDWSPTAVPYEAWIGGHSQRGPQHGASEPLLRDLLTPGAHPQAVAGLAIAGEDLDAPWQVRLHDRAVMRYRAHVLALRRG